ncbi:YihY/virulence factor BrkB family protein [Natronosalvus caseinilyticus]|uniref:YihY/virulence factor BrkB family protein n=1 Tax=Natronosalvus caseinilyticus TaxID=2953747 RepID=UPI0028ABF82A|nr:YihY/virulence factor BrkB family protein [Natronosalvus caseinilyticus]
MSHPSDRDVRTIVRGVVGTAKEREITFLAAGFAYYAFVSLFPMIVLALVVGTLVGGQQVAEDLIVLAGDFLPDAGEDLVLEALTAESGRTEATVVALAVSTWGALKVFRGLSLAFDRVYDTVAEDSLLEQIRDGITVILTIVLALLLMILIGAVIGLLAGRVPYVGVLSWLGLLLGLVLVFLPLYYVLPPIPVDIREVIPGAFFAAIGWVLLQAGFQLYAANAGQYEAYGAIGAILLFVTWLYFAGILILLGAVINVVMSRPRLVPT